MTTVRVTGLPPVPSRSRHVKRYVNAVRTRMALDRAHAGAICAVADARADLTGGQLGEATRILGGDTE